MESVTFWANMIPTKSVKSGDDCISHVHNIGIEAYIDSDKINLVYLVG